MIPLGGHRIDDISYAAERIVCTCAMEITAPPDHLIHDRHEPLCEAWALHRRNAGLGTPPLSTARRSWK